MNISFEAIVERCETIGDLQELFIEVKGGEIVNE